MKIRIRGQSLRIRTEPEEMRELASTGRIEDRIPLDPRRALVCRLIVAPGAQDIAVAFDDNVIEVRLPDAAAREWCTTDRVGLSGSQGSGDTELRVTVEKDFDTHD